MSGVVLSETRVPGTPVTQLQPEFFFPTKQASLNHDGPAGRTTDCRSAFVYEVHAVFAPYVGPVCKVTSTRLGSTPQVALAPLLQVRCRYALRQGGYQFEESLGVDGLGQVIIEAGLLRQRAILGPTISGHRAEA